MSFNEGSELDFNYDGPNGFSFDLDNLPSMDEQGPPGPQGEKGDTGAQLTY